MAMVPEIKERLVTALRSGKYTQGRHGLNFNDQEFCCLGVLCELALESGIVAKRFEVHHVTTTGQMRYDGAASLLPHAVVAWAGIGSPNGEYTPSDLDAPSSSLASDNDSGLTFAQIADIIEEEF